MVRRDQLTKTKLINAISYLEPSISKGYLWTLPVKKTKNYINKIEEEILCLDQK